MNLPSFKNFLLKNKDVFFVFILSFILFYIVQFSSENLAGNDTYLYIKLADMIKSGGLIREFPWLNATIINENFTGLHFLYYILLIPFTFLGSLIIGAKIASIFFLSLMLAVFYAVLKNLEMKFGYVWILFLLASSAYFLLRMNFARPLNLSVIFMLLIFFALVKKNNLLLFSASFLFVWAHGSFPLSIVLAFIFFAINYIYKKELYYKSILFSVGGIILANLINPFFPNNLNYFSIYYLSPTPYFLTSQIAEWQPIGLDDLFLSDATILIIPFLILSIIYVFSSVVGFINKKEESNAKDGNKERKIISSFLFLISIIFFVGTLLQGRFIDYWIPFGVMFAAFYFEIIYFNFTKSDKIKRAIEKIKFPKIFSKEDAKTTLICFAFIILGLSVYNKISIVSQRYSHDSSRDIKETALWLKENTPKKSIVFNVNWGDFSKLFFYNSENYYILGLDPKFLYLKSPEKYWLYDNIGKGIVCDKEICDETNNNKKSIRDVIKTDFHADYIYIPTSYEDFDYTVLINAMSADPNFEKVFENEGGEVWEVR
jgi:hypothetical protein